MVRTALLHRIDSQQGNIVQVTSAAPGHGKTTVAIMLARSLANCNKRVLLVDTDLRNPRIAKQLGINSHPGLVEALAGQADDSELIVELDTARLSIMTCGHVDNNVDPELIANGTFSEATKRWRNQFDVVLLDSPPVLPVADARILAHHADGTILVVWAERTRRADLAETLRYLTSAGGTLWGTILVGFPRRHSYPSTYSYGYGASS